MKTVLSSVLNRSLLFWVWLPLLLFAACSFIAFKAAFWQIALLPLALLVLYFIVVSSHRAYYFLLFTVPLSVPVTDIGAGLGLSLPAEPLIWVFFSLSCIGLFIGENRYKFRLNHPISYLLLLYILWNILSTGFSVMPLISLKYTLSMLWFAVVFYMLPLHLFRNIADAHRFLMVMMASTVILVIYTLYQHAGGGFSRPFAHTAMRPFLPDHGVYAALLAFFIPFGLIAFVFGHHFKLSVVTRMTIGAATVILLIGVIFSFTRASWISLVVAFGVMAMLLFRIRLWMFLSFFGMVLSVIIFYWADITNELSRNTQGSDDDFAKHLSSVYNISTDPSNLERLNRWDCAVQMVNEKPFLGWGPGTYTFQYAPFQKSYRLTLISTHAGDVGNVHSEFLRPMAESGWPGFFLFFILMASIFGFAWKLYEKVKLPEHKYLVLALAGGLSTYLFHGLVNNYLDFDKISAVFWGMTAILVAVKHWSAEEL